MDRVALKARILGEPIEFTDYLEDLVRVGRIEDETALGIAKYIIANGPENLSDKQWYTFLEKGLVEYNYVEECERCAEDIPWSEMFAAVYIEEDEYCGYCRHMMQKIENS